MLLDELKLIWPEMLLEEKQVSLNHKKMHDSKQKYTHKKISNKHSLFDMQQHKIIQTLQ